MAGEEDVALTRMLQLVLQAMEASRIGLRTIMRRIIRKAKEEGRIAELSLVLLVAKQDISKENVLPG